VQQAAAEGATSIWQAGAFAAMLFFVIVGIGWVFWKLGNQFITTQGTLARQVADQHLKLLDNVSQTLKTIQSDSVAAAQRIEDKISQEGDAVKLHVTTEVSRLSTH
jgi:hypothetical protein